SDARCLFSRNPLFVAHDIFSHGWLQFGRRRDPVDTSRHSAMSSIAKKRSAGLRRLEAAAAEDSSVINASWRFRLASSGVGSGIALAAHNPAFQIFAVVVDGAPETQEGWCIIPACDALLCEFAGWKAVFSLNLGRSEESLFHGVLFRRTYDATQSLTGAITTDQ